MSGRKKSGRKIIIGLVVFVVVAVGAFFGFQFFTKTGVFRIPGVVYYDDSLNTGELSTLKGIFNDEVDLDKDVTIKATTLYEKPTLTDNQFLYEVSVPVTDFYDARDDVNEFIDDEVEYLPIEKLSFEKKLLSWDGKYYLDSFSSGAKFRVISFESEKYDEEIRPLVESAFTKVFPDSNSVLTFAQTGVTALSRNMNAKIARVNDGNYFAENIGQFLSGFDITHTSNESSFTNYASSSNICSDFRFTDTLLAIGLDIVELTGNHNLDCGSTAAVETIDWYNENNIKIVGGGRTADEAAEPVEINQKNNKITMFAYNESTGGATYGNTPGANQYYEDSAAAEIAAAKSRGEFVIVDVQYYECNAYVAEYEDSTCDAADSAAGDQIGFFRHLIDLGADIVVGTSAHQPQTYELYKDGEIYYGLGNLFFDQYWWPGTTRSLILVHYFYNGKLLQTKIVPTVYDSNMQTGLLDEETKQWFLGRLVDARP
ncbi:CapA family protein [Candidatus Saccharibacteria bacterium]|nr:CapA family protein [Candidatus Saccharibacteria bacterium]